MRRLITLLTIALAISCQPVFAQTYPTQAQDSTVAASTQAVSTRRAALNRIMDAMRNVTYAHNLHLKALARIDTVRQYCILTSAGWTCSATPPVVPPVTPPDGPCPIASLNIAPSSVQLPAGQVQQYIAQGWCANAPSPRPNTPVTWTATGGTIDASGRYVAGAANGTFSVTARSVEVDWRTATGTVTITGAQPPPSGVTPFLEERFQYANVAEWRSDPRDIYGYFQKDGASQVSLIDVTGAPEGITKALRYTFFPDAWNMSNAFYFPDKTELWIEVWCRFSPSFTAFGPESGNGDYKWIMMHTNPDETGRFEVKAGTFASATAGGTIVIGGPYPESLPQNGMFYSGELTIPEVDNPGLGRYFDGTWTGVRMHMKINTATGTNPPNGAHRLWINRANTGWMLTEANATGLKTYSALHGVVTGIDQISMGANMNRGYGRTMTLDWGRVRAWDRNPGW